MHITMDSQPGAARFSEQMMLTRNGRGIFLRQARPADAADIIAIQQQVVEEGISAVTNRTDTVEERAAFIEGLGEGDLYLVADYQRRVVGSLLLRRPPAPFMRHHALLGVELHRDFRGYGLGGALICKAAAWARENGLELIRLGVLDTNPRARALYERLGFQQSGYIPNFVKLPNGDYVGESQMLLALAS